MEKGPATQKLSWDEAERGGEEGGAGEGETLNNLEENNHVIRIIK